MLRSHLHCLSLAVLLAALLYVTDSSAEESPRERGNLEGLWSGTWGGGGANGVVYQPVRAELFIKGNHVELLDFPSVHRLTGTVRIDANAGQLHVTPATNAGSPTAKTIVFTYRHEKDRLTLIDKDHSSVSLQKYRLAKAPLLNAQVDIVAATGINHAGDLLVTEFTQLRVGQAGATYFRPVNRTLKTKQATVLLVQESGAKNVSIDEARRLIRKPTPVLVSYRRDNRPLPNQPHRLWKEFGPPPPNNEYTLKTFSQILRPGTLIFILSAPENVPEA